MSASFTCGTSAKQATQLPDLVKTPMVMQGKNPNDKKTRLLVNSLRLLEVAINRWEEARGHLFIGSTQASGWDVLVSDQRLRPSLLSNRTRAAGRISRSAGFFSSFGVITQKHIRKVMVMNLNRFGQKLFSCLLLLGVLSQPFVARAGNVTGYGTTNSTIRHIYSNGAPDYYEPVFLSRYGSSDVGISWTEETVWNPDGTYTVVGAHYYSGGGDVPAGDGDTFTPANGSGTYWVQLRIVDNDVDYVDYWYSFQVNDVSEDHP
jgi:hypothetical protein